jgi:hypothetical protein
MKEIIMSVPHTGTRFVRKHFNNIPYYHTWLKWEDVMLRAEQADKIYLPLRHPEQVHRSWLVRERFYEPSGTFRWYTAWQQLQMVYHLFDCDVICVDKQEDGRIKNWAPVGHEDRPLPAKDDYPARWDVLFQLPVVKHHYTL